MTCGVRPLDDSTWSAEVAHQWILTAISKCSGADQLQHFCLSSTIDGYLVCVLLQLE